MRAGRGLVAFAICGTSLAIGGITPSACAASGMTSVVIRFDSQDARRYCVSANKSDSGLSLLRSTGLKLTTKDYGGSLGTAVCAIDSRGNRSTDCPGAKGHWHYWLWSDDSWVEAPRGASSISDIGPGHGWSWTEGLDAVPPPRPEALECQSPNPKDSLPSAQLLGLIVLGIVLGMILTAGLRRSKVTS